MSPLDYWSESLSNAAEECGLELTKEQLEYLADAAKGSHENYGLAFYSPPASDRISDIEQEWKLKLKDAQENADKYRMNAEMALRRVLNLRSDDQVSIREHGEVTCTRY